MRGKDRWPSGKEKTRVVFVLTDDAAETGDKFHVFETLGWIQDEDALRSALARAVKLEGLADTWDEIGRMCNTATFEWDRNAQSRYATRAYVIPL